MSAKPSGWESENAITHKACRAVRSPSFPNGSYVACNIANTRNNARQLHDVRRRAGTTELSALQAFRVLCLPRT